MEFFELLSRANREALAGRHCVDNAQHPSLFGASTSTLHTYQQNLYLQQQYTLRDNALSGENSNRPTPRSNHTILMMSLLSSSPQCCTPTKETESSDIRELLIMTSGARPFRGWCNTAHSPLLHYEHQVSNEQNVHVCSLKLSKAHRT